ncbi:MAG: aminomethyl-transferring glycine dehydrogenase [Nitrospinaceae bacterium]|jgi:glycine dehydrogenase|nr:aminomethyl-transferring glycine dehydrogenase [Nitrospinaceae bacterium]MBT3821246.1 aminomethyl-transferring glycine dehydrogenase [Nitrospinaceae bacterium]MBT4092432.1 aminomethyl-transferring glycine dehydrogenase [Nitrospinaceae bacterium]MBT4429713.1 aminomethyl-transferring glycine dehydrogenase [Nitrospinaceae bacterium]MBT5946693.1 aminomethyl-transferring glycine dehydrogenase [Nitrospinaceae bacterium]
MSDARASLEELENKGEFIRRHNGPDEADIAAMLGALDFSSLEELIEKTVPAPIISSHPLGIGESRTEQEVMARLKSLASKNRVFRSMIGMGYSDCHTPTVILRNILENPGWYTAYTPYQPEISQGRLEALLNFQTMVMDLTGMEMTNASLLDEATSAAEAMVMCYSISKSESKKIFISEDCHPQTIEVMKTRAEPMGIEIVVGDHHEGSFEGDPYALMLQYPASSGEVYDYASLVAEAHERGTLVIVAADLLSLTLLKPPGEFGADVVVGNTQRFGVPLGLGGPHAAYLATREKYKRSMPGRLVGVSVDASGAPALRLALQTREQHIRREKATSNICTSQVLLAVMAGMYAVYHGPEGLLRIGRRVHRLTSILAAGLEKLGCEIETENFFDTITVKTTGGSAEIGKRAAAKEINLRIVDTKRVGISFDETTRRQDIEDLWIIFSGGKIGFSLDEIDRSVEDNYPSALARTTDYLTHPVFNSYHPEHEMLRYIFRLQEKDIALTRSMIPLGSCTMKLNATTEMIPVSWPEFAKIHPFAPAEQTEGYRLMMEELKAMLADIAGFEGVSLQPNSGAQGEYTGLLTIRKYHESRGELHRNICLIPSSAHGTNPASASMLGWRVVVIACDKQGNVDLVDLRAKAAEHKDDLASLMITYPSTHGVFEEAVSEICGVIHDNGGQVYMDGANLNALVGICRPGEFGPDVIHINLHKTFSIPHGGGGPGAGPICVAGQLAPFLPKHSVVADAGPETGVGAVSAGPWGNAGVLPISWSYISMMGSKGLIEATQVAILNANYTARRLQPYYDVLYTGRNGMVAHECIIDLRPLKDDSGVSAEDVAKRLMDFGFHAPTMSFPVVGTLMIEPTESESKEELDRFCDAMITIREEIREIEQGRASKNDNVLKNAPHTMGDIASDEWAHPYSREKAVFPLPWVRANKYWPPVKRIDNPYGDKNLVCSCQPIESYA